MAIQNSLDLTATGIITADGSGAFTGSAVTEGGVLLGDASNGVTDTGVLAKGGLLVGDGSGAPTELSVGTNDYVLTADSAESSGIKWAAASSGGEWTELHNAAISGSPATYEVTGLGGYSRLYIIIRELNGNHASVGRSINLLPGYGVGPTYTWTGAAEDGSNVVAFSISGSVDSSNGSNYNQVMTVYNPTDSYPTMFWAGGMKDLSSNFVGGVGGGTMVNTNFGPMTGFQFYLSSGNLNEGTVIVYGANFP